MLDLYRDIGHINSAAHRNYRRSHPPNGATMSENPVPVPDATKPYWRKELHPLDSHQSSETLPSEQDIVIIGAGFAGAALAYYLLDGVEKSSRPTITVLEAREACSGATARNGRYFSRRIGMLALIFVRWPC